MFEFNQFPDADGIESTADIGYPQRLHSLAVCIPDLTESVLGLAFRAGGFAILSCSGATRDRERKRESRAGDVELVAGQVSPDPLHFVFHSLGFLFVLDEFDDRKAVNAGEPGG